jgi:hypothetical protein
VEDYLPVPLSEEGRLRLPLMTRALYRAHRVALGVLSPTERQLLQDHHGEDVSLPVLAARVGTTETAMRRRSSVYTRRCVKSSTRDSQNCRVPASVAR